MEHILQEGQQVSTTYTVERFLGEGAFAEVYRVRHRYLGRQALKIFKRSGMSAKEIEEMLIEPIMLSQIGHPNIIRVFDANVVETPHGYHGYFTMEYVAGGSLESFWKSFGVELMPTATAIDIITQATRGIAVAHNERPPIVHRDIKPDNILVGYDASGLRVRVSDFGLAKRANPLTLLVSARGARIFKAPEVFSDPQADSCRGDVWAMGCTLYLLLTDRFPFQDSTGGPLIDEASFRRCAVPPSTYNPQVGNLLDQIACRCLEVDPEDRYPSAKELLKDLEKWKPAPEGKKPESKVLSADSQKSALGELSSLDQAKAREMADKALRMAKRADRLAEAADLMEEACNKWPDLRQEYAYQIRLWRKGIMG